MQSQTESKNSGDPIFQQKLVNFKAPKNWFRINIAVSFKLHFFAIISSVIVIYFSRTKEEALIQK